MEMETRRISKKRLLGILDDLREKVEQDDGWVMILGDYFNPAGCGFDSHHRLLQWGKPVALPIELHRQNRDRGRNRTCESLSSKPPSA